MSEDAKKYRAAMKDKAHRMATGDPHQKVDASSWSPSEPLDTEAKTGMRPVSRRQYKRGGKVAGAHEKRRADRKPRKTGGRALVDDFMNRDQREANEERAGTKHVGGFKSGGRTKRALGGDMPGGTNVPTVPVTRFNFQGGPSQMSRAAGLKTGGSAKHPDEAEDRKLIKATVKPKAIKDHPDDCECKRCMGGRTYKAGGSVSDGELEGTRPTGGRLARKHGGEADNHWIKGAIKHPGALHRELHVAEGKKIPAKKLEKAEHSTNKLVAKRAHLAETLKSLHRKSGGRAGKGKMSVNIVIAPGGGQGQPPMAQGAPMPPPHPIVPPAMPQGMPPGMPPGAGGPPPMAGPPGLPPPGMMPRKRGGKIPAGSGSGLGRLEKMRDYGHNAKPDSRHY